MTLVTRPKSEIQPHTNGKSGAQMGNFKYVRSRCVGGVHREVNELQTWSGESSR